MKITNSKENILKSSILFLTFTAFIMAVLLFTSCSENSETLTDDDTALIAQIESATRQSISIDNLPTAAISLDGELSDSYTTNAELATNLGYKVGIATDNVAREESNATVYFNLQGRQLEDRRDNFRRRRNRCFEFVFPVDFIMPDATSITLNSSDDWVLIKDWYEANPDANERPELVFPVEVTLEDGTVQTLIDRDELREVKQSCREGRDKRKCFKLVLPVSFTMPDASVITVNERTDWRLIRQWHIANPDIDEKGALNYPVEIEYRDNTIVAIADETEMQAAKDTCN
mgnify:CR=1 FL=1